MTNPFSSDTFSCPKKRSPSLSPHLGERLLRMQQPRMLLRRDSACDLRGAAGRSSAGMLCTCPVAAAWCLMRGRRSAASGGLCAGPTPPIPPHRWARRIATPWALCIATLAAPIIAPHSATPCSPHSTHSAPPLGAAHRPGSAPPPPAPSVRHALTPTHGMKGLTRTPHRFRQTQTHKPAETATLQERKYKTRNLRPIPSCLNANTRI